MKKDIITRYVVPGMGVFGIAFAIFFTAFIASSEPVQTDMPNAPFTSPFDYSVSGSGIVEANTENISIGSHLPGIVANVSVIEGASVEAGDPLFKLDDRTALAEVVIQESEVASAKSQVDEARANLADQQDQLKRAENLKTGVSVTAERVERLRYAARAAQARLSVAQSRLDSAHARLQAADVNLDKMTVRAPVAGKILKVNIRPGEYVQTGGATSSTNAYVVLGNDDPLYVRVSIDENDVWRFKTEAPAVAAVRGNKNINFPLEFVRLEPYVVPKRSLTGDTSERVDTRVLEVLYSVKNGSGPVFIGQQVDVFIKAEDKP